MKRNILAVIAIVFTIISLTGCGENEISNDIISISNYKNLKVSDSADDEEVWKELLSNCTFEEYPEEELKVLIEELNTQYSYVAYYEGKDSSELIEEIHGMTTEELAKEQLMKTYAVDLIAEKEGLNLTDKEYKEKLQAAAKDNGFDDAKEYESLFGQEELQKSILEERVLDFLRRKGGK